MQEKQLHMIAETSPIIFANLGYGVEELKGQVQHAYALLERMQKELVED